MKKLLVGAAISAGVLLLVWVILRRNAANSTALNGISKAIGKLGSTFNETTDVFTSALPDTVRNALYSGVCVPLYDFTPLNSQQQDAPITFTDQLTDARCQSLWETVKSAMPFSSAPKNLKRRPYNAP